MIASNVQKFKVGDQVPSEWFEISEPAKVTFGADCSFELRADGRRYGKADAGTWPAVIIFNADREGADLRVTFNPPLVMLSGSTGEDVFDITKHGRYSAK